MPVFYIFFAVNIFFYTIFIVSLFVFIGCLLIFISCSKDNLFMTAIFFAKNIRYLQFQSCKKPKLFYNLRKIPAFFFQYILILLLSFYIRLAVSTLIHCRICFMRTHLNRFQSTVIFCTMMMSTVVYITSNTFITRTFIHIFHYKSASFDFVTKIVCPASLKKIYVFSAFRKKYSMI